RQAVQVGIHWRDVWLAPQLERDELVDEPVHRLQVEYQIVVLDARAGRRRQVESAEGQVGRREARVVVLVAQPQQGGDRQVPAGRLAADQQALCSKLLLRVFDEPYR